MTDVRFLPKIAIPADPIDPGVIQGLPDDVLRAIYQGGNLAVLGDKYPDLIEKLTSYARSKTKHIPLSNNKISQGISASLTEAPSFPIVILWTLAGISSIGMVTLTLLTAGLGAIAVVAGGVYFGAIYAELKAERRQKAEHIQLLALKRASLYELNQRIRKDMDLAPEKNGYEAAAPELPKLKTKPKTVRLVLEVSLMVAATLLGTYFIATNAILVAFGLTLAASAMGGPIAIAVAVVLAFAIGGYFGYKQYQLCKKEEIVDQYQQHLEDDIEKEYETNRQLIKQAQKQKPVYAAGTDAGKEKSVSVITPHHAKVHSAGRHCTLFPRVSHKDEESRPGEFVKTVKNLMIGNIPRF